MVVDRLSRVFAVLGGPRGAASGLVGGRDAWPRSGREVAVGDGFAEPEGSLADGHD